MITSEGKCVGGSASEEHFNLTVPFMGFFLTIEPLKNEDVFRNIGRDGDVTGLKIFLYTVNS